MTADEFSKLRLTTMPFRARCGTPSRGRFYYCCGATLRILRARRRVSVPGAMTLPTVTGFKNRCPHGLRLSHTPSTGTRELPCG
jgi:hypothetical protein